MDSFFHLASGILLWSLYSFLRSVRLYRKAKGGTEKITPKDLKEKTYEGFGPMFGSIIPDIDILFYSDFQTLFYFYPFVTHRTFFHSFEFAIIFGVFIFTIVLIKRLDPTAAFDAGIFSFGGVMLHTFLDKLGANLREYNTFGFELHGYELMTMEKLSDYLRMLPFRISEYIMANTRESQAYLMFFFAMLVVAIFLYWQKVKLKNKIKEIIGISRRHRSCRAILQEEIRTILRKMLS